MARSKRCTHLLEKLTGQEEEIMLLGPRIIHHQTIQSCLVQHVKKAMIPSLWSLVTEHYCRLSPHMIFPHSDWFQSVIARDVENEGGRNSVQIHQSYKHTVTGNIRMSKAYHLELFSLKNRSKEVFIVIILQNHTVLH